MTKINIQGPGVSLPEGNLQVDNPLDNTLQVVKDTAGTGSPLELSTDLVSVSSTLQIATDDTTYIDAEDSLGNNRFTVSRVVGQQHVNIDFASNPTLSTKVGAIRTYQDGVNLSDAISVEKNGQTTFTERVKVEADSTATTQSTAVIQSSTTNAGIAIVPNGTGAITADIPDGTVAGGNARGTNAVDLQMSRNTAGRVASGNYSVVMGGSLNTSSGNNSTTSGYRNTAGGSGSVALGWENNASAEYTNALGVFNNATSNYSTISGGQSNTASTGTHATVVGGQSNTSSGQYSVSGGVNSTASGYGSMAIGGQGNNVASGYGSIAMGNATASGTRTVAIGVGANVSGFDGAIAFVGGQVSGSGEGLGAVAFGRSKTTSIGGFSFGNDSLSYLRNQFVQSPINIYGGNTLYLGHSQASQVVAVRAATLNSAGTTILSLDGTGTTNLIIPSGNNRAWNVSVEYVAVCTVQGSGTTVVGDVVTGTDKFRFKRVGGTSSIGAVTNIELSQDATMTASICTYAVGGSQNLQITYVAPTTANATTFRVVAKVSLVEVAW